MTWAGACGRGRSGEPGHGGAGTAAMRLAAATERRIKDGGSEARMFRQRAMQGFAFVLVCLLALAGRYAWLQVVKHEEYATRSESNRVRLQPVAPARGLIHDRNGVLLAENRPAFRLELVPERVDDLEQVLAGLAERVQLDELDLEKFHQAWAGARRYQPVPLKFRLSELEIARLAIDQHRFPAVQVTAYQSRHYVYGRCMRTWSAMSVASTRPTRHA